MMLYHYTGFENALDDILHHHIKVATLDRANDPNEWVFCLKKPDGTYYSIDWVRKRLHDDYSHKYGFLSFSRKNDNPVMWSHYAKNHTGIVLGFECSPDLKLFQVQYRSKRVELLEKKIMNAVPPALNGLFEKQISWKSKDWKYEDEWRGYLTLSESCETRPQNGKLIYFYPFDRTLKLKEIVIGYAAQDRVNEIQNALYYGGWRDVAIKVAKLSQTHYKMDIEEYKNQAMPPKNGDKQEEVIKETGI